MCCNLRNFAYVQPVVESVPDKIEDAVLDDVSAFLTLCPVNSVTGRRGNPLDALSLMLKPSEARLVQEVLQEIPSSGVPSDIGDFTTLPERLNVGTDAENAKFLNKLAYIADDLRNIQPALRTSKDSISFNKNDEETKDS